MDIMKHDLYPNATLPSGAGLSSQGIFTANAGDVYNYEENPKPSGDKRHEIINDVTYLMPANSHLEHQAVSVNLIFKFKEYLQGKQCQILHAPFDVHLMSEGESRKSSSNVVQPDIFVVCEREKLDRRGCFGSPDLIIEILSPTSRKRDFTDKFNLYQKYAVQEYWIVDAFHQTIDLFSYDKETDKYKPAQYFDRNDTISSLVFPYLTVKLEDVFPLLDEMEERGKMELQ